MNAISFYRIERWLFERHIPILPKIIQGIIFFLFNSKITPNSKIGKGTYCVCKGISTVLIPGTVIGENCVLGLRFSTVRQFPYKDVPCLKNNVWIGPNVIISGPVIIEDDVIVVGNSYVTKSVPKGAIVSGSPARIVGWRKNLNYEINSNPKFLDGVMPYLQERKQISKFIDEHTDSVSEKVIHIIAKCLEIPCESLSGTERIEDIGEWDSLKNIMIISALESAFSIKIPLENYIKLNSIHAYIDVVKKIMDNSVNCVDTQKAISELNVVNVGEISHSPLLRELLLRAKEDGAKTAIINGNESASYAVLVANIRRMASLLDKLGLKSCDKILLSGQKDLEFVYVYFASQLLGVINVIVDAKTNKERLKYIEDLIEPKYCIGFRSDRVPSYTFDELRYCDEKPYSIKRTELFPDNICEILFTTGTTDKPKGVCLSYNNVFGSVTNINGYIGNSKSDIEIIGLPICHSFGLGRLRCNLINGQTVVLIENFANVGSFLSCIEKYNVTGFGIVPAAWAYVMKMGGRAISQYFDQIKYIEIGSASMPHEVKLEMLRMFPNTRICMHYGSTEASRSCFMEFHDEKHLDSIGLPVSEKVDIKIFDSSGFEVPIGVSGEICIKGNMVMPYYLSDKGRCDSFWGEYFRTGDTGYKSGDGYYYLLGRTKEIINVGGKKVSPSEVEDVICSLGVGDCLCVPMEDPEGIMGEVVKCYVLRNSTTLTFDEIALKLVDKLETYKRPVEYEWIDEIPCTPSGKKQRMNIINS